MGTLNTTPRTFVDGELETAAIFNAEVRDTFTNLQSAWTTYTPTWTAATTAPVLSNGVIEGRYERIGKTVSLFIRLTMGSTTTFGTGGYSFSLPFAGLSVRGFSMTGFLLDASAGTFTPFAGLCATTTTVSVQYVAALPSWTPVTGLAPVTLAVSDVIVLNGTFEAA